MLQDNCAREHLRYKTFVLFRNCQLSFCAIFLPRNFSFCASVLSRNCHFCVIFTFAQVFFCAIVFLRHCPFAQLSFRAIFLFCNCTFAQLFFRVIVFLCNFSFAQVSCNLNNAIFQGEIQNLQGDVDDAEDSFTRCLSYATPCKDQAFVCLQLGDIFADQDKFEEARNYYLHACRLSPTAISWLGVGICSLRMNRLLEGEFLTFLTRP